MFAAPLVVALACSPAASEGPPLAVPVSDSVESVPAGGEVGANAPVVEAPASPPAVAPPPGPGAQHHHGHRAHVRHELRRSESRPLWGGFGYFSPGFLVGHFDGVAGALAAPGSFGAGAAPGRMAFSVGGGGKSLIGGRFLFGGKGFGLIAPTAANDVGRVAAGGGGGGVELGLVVVNKRGWLVYPFTGFGGMGYSLSLTNTSQTSRTFGDQTIAAGKALELGTGSVYVEFGAGFRRLTFTRGGGFIHGAELGLMLALDQGPWRRSDGRAVGGGVPGVNMSGLYLRVDIGGGGFSWTEDVERWRQRRAERRARRGRA